MPLGTINTEKEQYSTYQSLLLAVVTFHDGAVARYASHEVTYGGNVYTGRVLNQDIAASQALSENGIDVPASVTLRLADADFSIWTNHENGRGWKGARLVLTAVLYDIQTGSFTSDSRVIFRGVCREPGGRLPTHDGKTFAVGFVSLLQMADVTLPSVQIQKTCPWAFPATAGERQAAADDSTSDFYRCGYSPDATGSNARGNLNAGSPFTACSFTKEACEARGMYSTDSSSRATARFGGCQWQPPENVVVRGYGSKWEWLEQKNRARYGDPVPMLWGTARVEPKIVSQVVDGNFLKMEAVVCLDQIEYIYEVTVNDTYIPHTFDDALLPGVPAGIADASAARRGGWWKTSSTGARTGAATNDAGYNDSGGVPQGDPHGSMCVIEIVVPRALADVNSDPRVSVLAKRGSENPATQMLDVLRNWAAWETADLNTASFTTAEGIADATINYSTQFGATGSHKRFISSLYLRDRASAADIIRGLRANMRAVVRPDSSGLLEVLVKRTLADQQPATVAGSNYNTAVGSKTAAGSAANGYVAYRFDESNINDIRASIISSGNRFQIVFQNADNRHSLDAFQPVDSDDIRRIDREAPGQFAVLGVTNYDQAARLIAAHVAEQNRGNSRADTGGTISVDLMASLRAIHLGVGDIVMLNYQPLGLANVLFRVHAIRPEANFERAALTLHYHNDDWYVDTYGQRDQPRFSGHRRNRLERPAWPWLPFGAQPTSGDSFYDTEQYSFAMVQRYEAGADGDIAVLDIAGKQIVNNTVPKPQSPFVPLQGTTASTGGTLAGGRSYYVALVAKDAAGNWSGLSQVCVIGVPAGTSTNTVTVPNIEWGTGASGYVAFMGENPGALSMHVDTSGTPSSITITSLKRATHGPPDGEFDHFRVRVKPVIHSGVWGAAVAAVTSTTIQISGASFTTNQWAGYDVSWIGRNSEQALPVANWRVASNTADTLTLAGGAPSPVALGLAAGDVVAMRSLPTYGTDGGGSYVSDANWVNSFAPSGLTVDALVGKVLRVILGPGGGQVARITSNTATKIYADFAIALDSTSRYIVEEPNWSSIVDTASINNGSASASVEMRAEVPNYAGQTVLVQVLTVDGGGAESVEAFSPAREIYVFGSASTAADGWVDVAGAATVTPDLANGINQEITLDRASTTIAAPIYTGGTLEAGQALTISLKQDATGGRQATWNSAYLVPDGAEISTAASTRSVFSFVYRPDGKWMTRYFPVTGLAG